MATPKYTPLYPRLAYAEGEKCGHRQNRSGGRIPLACVRAPHGNEVNHLHDVPPEYLADAIYGGAKIT